MKMTVLATAIIASATTLSGCLTLPVQGQNSAAMSAEQQAMAQQMREALLANLKRNSQLGAADTHAQRQAAAPVNNVISEQALAETIEALRSSELTAEIEHSRDGILINGVAYLDPEGEVGRFAANERTGEIVYTIDVDPNTKKVKALSAGSRQSVHIGDLTKSGNRITFRSVTGQTVVGERFYTTSQGVMLARSGSVFHYVPGRAMQSVPIPDGYVLADFQNGDYASTGYLLMERLPPEEGSIAAMGKMFSDLGSKVGLSKSNDYVLVNPMTGHQVVFDIAASGKTVSKAYNCENSSSLIRKCADSVSYEALYDERGLRNLSHYFWKLDWFQTPEGPFGIVMESGLKDINIVDLRTGERVNLFNRTLGIAGHDVIMKPDGRIKVSAKLGFSSDSVDDAVALFKVGEKLALNES